MVCRWTSSYTEVGGSGALNGDGIAAHGGLTSLQDLPHHLHGWAHGDLAVINSF